MLSRKSRKFEKNQKEATNTSKQTDSLDKFKKQLCKLEKKSESSQSPDLPHKNIGDLIKEKQGDKEACENAFSDLLKSTTRAKKKLEKILQNEKISPDYSVERQLAVIEKDPYLNDLMSKDIIEVGKEKDFLIKEKYHKTELGLQYSGSIIYRRMALEPYKILFHACGIDLDAHLDKKHLEPPQYFSVERCRKDMDHLSKRLPHLIPTLNSTAQAQGILLERTDKEFRSNPIIQSVQDIAQRRLSLDESRKKLADWEESKKIIQSAKEQFEVAIYDPISIVEASKEALQIKPKYGRKALRILQEAYLQQIQHNIKKSGKNVDKKNIMDEFQKAWNSGEKEAEIPSIQKILKEHDGNAEHIKKEQGILQEGLKLTVEYYKSYENKQDKNVKGFITNCRNALSFYDFIEKNITRRPSNSLDELEKKSREALRLLENEIKELESLQRSEQSAQPQTGMEKLLPEDKLQKDLATSLENANMTDQRKYIVTSYMRGLFEKSDHQSLDKETIAKFCKENIEEAKQVEAYLEQKHFIHNKIRDEAIKLAVHLKHEFGIPIHHASIDADFNIVRSQKSSAITFKLEINPQGKILKDNRVQRVYLIGFQDPPETSSNHADAKPMALLAIQSGNTGYSKFGAGTPLPTGGVVDVVTAQHTRQDQRNLYKATLSLETLQETHDQKEIDIPTLEFFETETVKNYHTKAALYDVTTFAGKVKDRPNQAPADTSKQEKAYQETTGPCMIDLDELTSAVKQELGLPDRFRPSPIVMESIKRQIAKQTLGEEKVPTSDEGWKTNGQRCWADYEYSTSMNMFAKYLAVAYREKLGLARSK